MLNSSAFLLATFNCFLFKYGTLKRQWLQHSGTVIERLRAQILPIPCSQLDILKQALQKEVHHD